MVLLQKILPEKQENLFMQFKFDSSRATLAVNWIILLMALTMLYISSHFNYLLFHSFAEIFSICIAYTVFIIAWNSKKYLDNGYLIFIGIAYLFVGILDLFHTLSYKGMAIFTDYDFYANQIWIATRFLESVSVLIAFAFLFIKRNINWTLVISVFCFITTLILLSVFYWKIFPICFVEGAGLTRFKVMSEYVICAILMIDIVLLVKYRNLFDAKVYQYLLWSFIFTIGSELAFTFYISNYGFSNLIGHYFKIISFYLMYKAIIEKAVKKPYEIIFRELKTNQEELQIIMDSSPIMIFYKDLQNKFIRVNRVLAEATGVTKEAMEGKTAFEIYPNNSKDYWEDDKEVIASGKPKIGIIEPIDTESGKRWLQTDKIPYRDKEGRIAGIVGFSIDITDRKQAEDALEEERRRLQQALDEVRTLRGIVPICASCKKIRDDNGYWNQVEKYISERTDAEFSHGICPECAKKLYPEYYEN